MNWLIKVRVDIHLRSGATIRFYCDKITTTRRADNALSGLDATNTRGWPIYVRLDDVSAVVTRRRPFWCQWGVR